MITEIVKFALPGGMSRAEVLDRYRKTVDRWKSNPDLLRKHYFFDPERSLGGGVYVWKDLEAQRRWHGDEYRDLIRMHYGSEPQIECFDTLIVVDNDGGAVSEIDAE